MLKKNSFRVEQIARMTGHKSAIYTLSKAKHQKKFFTGGGEGWLVEWDLDNPEKGYLIAETNTNLFSTCALPQQNLLLAGNRNGGLHVVNVKQKENIANILHHQQGLFGIHYINDKLFTVGGDGRLSVWDVNNLKALESLRLSSAALRCLCYNKNTQKLIIGASDNNIYIINIETLELEQTLLNAHKNSVFSVALSPNYKYLCSGGRDAQLKIWNTEDAYSLKHSIPAHLFTINQISFHEGQAVIATASRDKTIKIWDAQSFQLLKVLEGFRDNGHINSVNNLLWIGDVLLSCSDDRTVLAWQFDFDNNK